MAQILSVTEKSVRDFIQAGEIEAVKVGQWRISREAVGAFMEARKNLFPSQARKEVLDFLDGAETLAEGEQRTLVIMDYQATDHKAHGELVNSLSQTVQGGEFHWKYLYDMKKRRARHILRGELPVLLTLVTQLDRRIKGEK